MKLFKNLFLFLSLAFVLYSPSTVWAHGNHFHSLNDVTSHIEDGDADEYASDDRGVDEEVYDGDIRSAGTSRDAASLGLSSRN